MNTEFNLKIEKEQKELKEIAQFAIAEAKKLGVDEASADIDYAKGLSISTRDAELENIEFNQDRSLSVTVRLNKKTGHAHTTDLSEDAVVDTVNAAFELSKYADSDPFSGLLEKEYLSDLNYDLDNLYEPLEDSKKAIDTAIDLDKMVESCKDTLIRNSDGAYFGSRYVTSVLANTNGFCRASSTSSSSVGITLIGVSNDKMQKGSGFARHCDYKKIASNDIVFKEAYDETISKLDARAVKTNKYKIIFKDSAVISLWRCLLKGLAGSRIYKKTSYLNDKLNEQILPSFVNLHEDPFLKGSIYSSNYDDEGGLVYKDSIIEKGVIRKYLLSSYSARKLNMKPTGHAGGTSNLFVTFDDDKTLDFADLLCEAKDGLVITSLMGSGFNETTGDYSVGASGYYFENGKRVHAVDEITIASNILDIFKNIQLIANDVDDRFSIKTGSVLVNDITVSGN